MSESINAYNFKPPTVKTVLVSISNIPTSVRPIIPGSIAPEIGIKQPIENKPNLGDDFTRLLSAATKRRK